MANLSCSILMILLMFTQPLHAQELEKDSQNPAQNSKLDAHLGKKYILITSDLRNFIKVMKALDVGFFVRLGAMLASPEISLTKSGNEYTFTSRWVFRNVVQKFKPGVPFAHVTPDGRQVTATMTMEGPTLHEVNEEENGRRTTIDRTFSDKQVKTVVTVGKAAVATRIYGVEQLKNAKAVSKTVHHMLMH